MQACVAANHDESQAWPSCLAGRLVLETENATPVKDAFVFSPICDGLNRAGEYRMEYTLTPALPQHAPLKAALNFMVGPAPATSLVMQVDAMQMLFTSLLGLHYTC